MKLPFPSAINITALSLLAIMGLSACGTTHSQYADTVSGPSVASDTSYKPANLRPYTVRGKTYRPTIPSKGWSETGLASWYAYKSPNAITANGEPFDTDQLAAAHKTLPLPSIVEVTNLENGRKIRVRVNDRGPFVDGRIIDLSRQAARSLGVYAAGTSRVRVTFLGPADPKAKARTYGGLKPDDAPNYIVQIGAFVDRTNAEAARRQLPDARIRESRGLYVVYLGPYSGAAIAEQQRQRSMDAGYHDSILRHEN